MRIVWKLLAWMSACALVSPALGGLVVTSYRTLASTNGYAPTSQGQYFSEQLLDDTSPAVAQVSGDWTGPNADGTPNTWHFVGTSHATSTTTITRDSYLVEAAASFAYQLDTTAGFVDPSSTSIFGPGGVASYRGFFEADVPIAYSLTVQLNQRGTVRLISSDGSIIFSRTNTDVVPQFLDVIGTLPVGSFNILVGAGLGLGNRPNGINHVERSGSFENLFFTARIPEPSSLAFATFVVTVASRHRSRRIRF